MAKRFFLNCSNNLTRIVYYDVYYVYYDGFLLISCYSLIRLNAVVSLPFLRSTSTTWRLKTIQRKTKLGFKEPNTQTEEGGGPRHERNQPEIGDQLDEERCKKVISLMNHTSDREIILQKMKETFEYRQCLIHNSEETHTVLSVCPRLLDTKGLASIICFCDHSP